MITAAAAALTLAAVPAVSQAQEVYGTVGYGNVDTDTAKVGALQARLGYKFTPNLGVEGEASFGVKDDNYGGVNVKLKDQFGAYVVGFVPVTPKAELFARVGYSGATFDTSLGDRDADGVAYGVGGQYNVTDKDGVRFDWTRHDYDAGNADVYALSYSRKF
jgi:hypothetical protein